MKLSLLTKLLAPSFFLFTAVIVYIGFVTQQETESAIKQTIMNALKGELRGIHVGLESKLTIYEEELLALSKSPVFAPLFTTSNPEDVAKLQNTINVVLKSHAFVLDNTFEFINVVDTKGQVIASSLTKNINTSVDADPTVNLALQGEQHGSLPQAAAYGTAILSFSAPVRVNNVVVGAVQGHINFQKIAEENIASIRFGQSGHAFVATDGGYIVYHPDPSQVMVLPATTWLTPRMTQEKQGLLRYTWNNQPWLALFSTGARSGLTFIVKVQEEELLAPATTARNAMFKSLAMAFVVFMLGMFVLVRRIVGSIKQVANYAEAVANGNMDTSLDVRTNDEIGILADALRRMVEGLRKLIASNNTRIAEAEQGQILIENAMQIKEQFLARVSHEIRTPMNSIIGFSHLCLQTALSSQQRAYIQNVHTSGLDLLHLVNEILDFSTPFDETSQSEQVSFDLNILLYNLTAIYKSKADAKQLTFSSNIAPDTPKFLLGNPQRLRQVLSSLLDNAIKFTDAGFIKLEVMCLPEAERTIVQERLLNEGVAPHEEQKQENEQETGETSSLAQRQTFELLFCVRDSGSGMTQEQLVLLFEGFAQADSSFTRKQGGLGLGLPVAKRLVESMGGHLLVDSTLDTGSIFSVHLCFQVDRSAAFSLGANSQSNIKPPVNSDKILDLPLSCAQILLVEDNIFNQQIAIELLQEYDINITVANNGHEALEALERERFDLVLMDIQMPVMDGLETAMRIREHNSISLPIIALTAHSSAQDREQSRRAGMNAHLTKPVNPEELIQTLLQWIPLRCNIASQPKKDVLTDHSSQVTTPPIPSSLIMDDNTDAVLSATKGLSHVAGNKNLYIKLLGRFLQDHTDETRKIQNSLADGDIVSACRLAHTMKSVAATLGADALSAVAKQLELTLREPDLPPINELNTLCAVFNTQLQRASVAIKIYLHKEGVPFASASELMAASSTGSHATSQNVTPRTAPTEPALASAAVSANSAQASSSNSATSAVPNLDSFQTSTLSGVAEKASESGPAIATPPQTLTNNTNEQAPILLGRQSILLVDDSPEQLIVLEEILGAEHNVHLASSGTEALQYLDDLVQHKSNNPLPDLILLDVLMPGLDGYATCKELKKLPGCKDIPIMFLTGMSDTADEARGLALGAVDYIIKPFQPELLKSRVQRHLELKHIRTNLEHLVEERTQEITLTQKVTIETLATLAEYRSLETGDHIKRTQRYVQVIAEHMSHKPAYQHVLTPKLLRDLELSAPLHDIGKVGIPDTILCKPGKLTAEEFEEMKMHTIYGHNALSAAETTLGKQSFLSVARLIAIAHHEKWDGSGYPNYLSGEDIPLVARIMAIADVYDALTTMRVYKPAFTHEQTRAIIVKDRGTHFDPGIVDAFLEQQDAFIAIATEQGA